MARRIGISALVAGFCLCHGTGCLTSLPIRGSFLGLVSESTSIADPIRKASTVEEAPAKRGDSEEADKWAVAAGERTGRENAIEHVLDLPPYRNPLEDPQSQSANERTKPMPLPGIPPIPDDGRTKADRKTGSDAAPKRTRKDEPAQQRATSPAPQREGVLLALEAFLDNRNDEAIQHLSQYDPEAQEFFLRVFPIIARLAKEKRLKISSDEAELLHEQLAALQTLILDKTKLTISNAAFCSYIGGFGDYAPLPADHVFAARTEHRPGERVLLYVQLENVGCRRSGDHFETLLSSSISILDASGKTAHYQLLENGKRPIRTQSVKRDFYRGYSFFVPRLPPGTYTLVLEVRDHTFPGRVRSAKTRLRFRVGM